MIVVAVLLLAVLIVLPRPRPRKGPAQRPLQLDWSEYDPPPGEPGGRFGEGHMPLKVTTVIDGRTVRLE